MTKIVIAHVTEPCMQHEFPARINHGFPGVGPIAFDKSEVEAMRATAGITDSFMPLRSTLNDMEIEALVCAHFHRVVPYPGLDDEAHAIASTGIISCRDSELVQSYSCAVV